MGLARADWHLPDVEMNASDPFESVRRETSALDAPPQVSGPGGERRSSALSDLVLEEAVLDARGVTCHLKERDWAHPSCSRCPERGDIERHELCRVGLAQEAAIVADVG